MKQLSIYDNPLLDNQEQFAPLPLPATHREGNLALSAEPTFPDEPNTEVEPDNATANVTEIILTKAMANNVQLILSMLTELNQEQRWLAWVDPPMNLLKSWQQSKQTELGKDIMVLRSSETLSAFELAKKALQAGTSHAVIVWTNKLTGSQLSELEHASGKGNSHGIVLRFR